MLGSSRLRNTTPYLHGLGIQHQNTYALDIALSSGTEVFAPADGIVSYVDPDPCGLGGRELAIRHTGPTGKPFETVFLHLKEILVDEGQVDGDGMV